MINVGEFAQITTAIIAIMTFIMALIGFVVLHLKIEIIHRSTNSMKDELVKEVKEASIAQGRLEQRQLDNTR